MKARIHAKSSYITSNSYVKVWKLRFRIDLIERNSVTPIRYCTRKGNCVTLLRFWTLHKKVKLLIYH